jgi:hypothetical protein
LARVGLDRALGGNLFKLLASAPSSEFWSHFVRKSSVQECALGVDP